MIIVSRIQKSIEKAKKSASKIINGNTFLKRLATINTSFNDDKGNHKVGYITYYMFLSILPLLIASLTIFDMVFAGNEELRKKLISSTLSSIPVIGTTLQSDLSFVKGQGVTLVVTVLLLLWSTRGGALALQDALSAILTKKDVDKSFISKQLRAYACLGVISIGIILPTVANSFVDHTLFLRILVFALSIGWNAGVIFIIFALLIDYKHARGTGPIYGGVAIALIQFLSVLILNHTLNNARPLYGTLAIVLALMFWISLQVKVLLFAAEINATA